MYGFNKCIDLPRIIFLVMFFIFMMFFSIFIFRPFFVGFSWASIFVISTWPLMLRLQNFFFGKRFLSVISMILVLLLFFLAPILFIANSFIDNIYPLINFLNLGSMLIPNLDFLQDIPIIGHKLFFKYHLFLYENSTTFVSHFKSYISNTSMFLLIQAGNLSRFFLHVFCMFLFTVLLYLNGERVSGIIRRFAIRLGGKLGNEIIILAINSIRAVVLGIVLTSFIQGILSGLGLLILGISYSSLFIIVIIMLCFLQLGPLPVLLPISIGLFWKNQHLHGVMLLTWSIIICIFENIFRPYLIKLGGGDLPTFLSVSGALGGLLTFGMIGLFVGPVILVISYRLFILWMNNRSISSQIF